MLGEGMSAYERQQRGILAVCKDTTIYGLVDPLDGKIRYVGQSIDPAGRLKDHLRAARRRLREGSNAGGYAYLPVYGWLAMLLAAGLRPEMRTLEIVPGRPEPQPGADCFLRETLEAEFRWETLEAEFRRETLEAEFRWIDKLGVQLYNVETPLHREQIWAERRYGINDE